MNTQVKNLFIGLFLIGAVSLFVGFFLFLKPSVGDEKQTLFVRFSDINKINVGTRVLFAGKAVGEVTDVAQIFHARETQPSDNQGRLYFYQLTLKIDSSVKVFNTDEIAIQTSGLLGEKSIAIIPKKPPKGFIPERITEKTPFYADSSDPIESAFVYLSDIGEKLEDTIDLVKSWLEQNMDNLSHAVKSFASSMDEIDTLTHSINEQNLVADVKVSVQNFGSASQKIDDALAQMQKDQVFVNIGPTVANLRTTSANVSQITQTIADGKGTIGKLVEQDDFYLRMTAIMSKADTMMNDINHYGILFHLNKGWQKIRTKKLSLLNALETPDDFKNYFQSEVDQINTAMSRLSMLINKARANTQADSILKSPCFKKDFAELLREVDEMSSNLKLYNEEFTEAMNP